MNERLLKIFSSDGQATGELALAKDWSQHPLGPMDQWPKSLLMTLGLIFNSKHPMCIFWGEKAFFFFNDGYLPIVSDKKAWAMGQEASIVWAEAWEEYIRPLI